MIGAEAVPDHTSELQFDTEMVRRKVGKGERESQGAGAWLQTAAVEGRLMMRDEDQIRRGPSHTTQSMLYVQKALRKQQLPSVIKS